MLLRRGKELVPMEKLAFVGALAQEAGRELVKSGRFMQAMRALGGTARRNPLKTMAAVGIGGGAGLGTASMLGRNAGGAVGGGAGSGAGQMPPNVQPPASGFGGGQPLPDRAAMAQQHQQKVPNVQSDFNAPGPNAGFSPPPVDTSGRAAGAAAQKAKVPSYGSTGF